MHRAPGFGTGKLSRATMKEAANTLFVLLGVLQLTRAPSEAEYI